MPRWQELVGGVLCDVALMLSFFAYYSWLLPGAGWWLLLLHPALYEFSRARP